MVFVVTESTAVTVSPAAGVIVEVLSVLEVKSWLTVTIGPVEFTVVI